LVFDVSLLGFSFHSKIAPDKDQVDGFSDIFQDIYKQGFLDSGFSNCARYTQNYKAIFPKSNPFQKNLAQISNIFHATFEI